MTMALTLAFLLLLVAWLTAATTAVRSVSRMWLRHWVDQRLSGAAPGDGDLDRSHRLLIAGNAASALVVVLAGILLGAAHAEGRWHLAPETLFIALALLLGGQLLPRAIARRWAPRLVPVLLPPLRIVSVLLRPLVRGAELLASPFARAGTATSTDGSREGIEDLLREGELEGIGGREESEIITGVVEFGETVVRDAMTTRTAVFAVDEEMHPREMARAIAQAGYSRVPVFRTSLDEIIGMVHVFDVLKLRGEHVPPIRPVAHAPASKRCSELLFEMLRGQLHLAVVLDEYGGTAGIVTLEDLLEKLVGDIRDEHDEPMPLVDAPTASAVVLDASATLEEAARCIAAELPHDVDKGQTLGAALALALGRIPAIGERFRLGELEMVVVEAERSRVTRLLIQRADAVMPVELELPR